MTFNNVLFLVFLTLKLTGFITWSWWLVTAPLWLPLLIMIVLFLIVTGTGVILGVIEKKTRSK